MTCAELSVCAKERKCEDERGSRGALGEKKFRGKKGEEGKIKVCGLKSPFRLTGCLNRERRTWELFPVFGTHHKNDRGKKVPRFTCLWNYFEEDDVFFNCEILSREPPF